MDDFLKEIHLSVYPLIYLNSLALALAFAVCIYN